MTENNIARSAAVTGHRNLCYGLDREQLKKTFEELVKRGFVTFYVGLATGFDTECFHVLKEIRKSVPIRIVGCAPYRGQSDGWNEKDRDVYRKMCSELDEKVVLNEFYTPCCMHERNRYMVDNSSVLVAYLKRRSGGTYYTVRYARETGKEIVYV